MQNIRSDIMHHVELFVCIYLFTLSRISSVTSDVGRRRYSDLQPEESNHPIEFINHFFRPVIGAQHSKVESAVICEVISNSKPRKTQA